MQEAVFINRCMGNVLRMSTLEDMYEMSEPKPEANLEEYSARINESFQSEFLKIQSDFFTSETGAKLVNKDKILQDFYFDWLFATGQYDKIINHDGAMLAPEGRVYNLALIELARGRKLKAYRCLLEFFDMMYSSEYDMQLLKEKRLRKSISPFIQGLDYYIFGLYFMLARRYGLFEYFNEGDVSRSSAMTMFRMKDLNSRGKYDAVIDTYEQYIDNEKLRKRVKRKSRLKYQVRRALQFPLRVLAKREYRIAQERKLQQ
jgi:hypothetical protein